MVILVVCRGTGLGCIGLAFVGGGFNPSMRISVVLAEKAVVFGGVVIVVGVGGGVGRLPSLSISRSLISIRISVVPSIWDVHEKKTNG